MTDNPMRAALDAIARQLHDDDPAAFHGTEANHCRFCPEPNTTVCVCGHTRGEHITVSGRLLCDACDPDSTDNLVCKGFDAL